MSLDSSSPCSSSSSLVLSESSSLRLSEDSSVSSEFVKGRVKCWIHEQTVVWTWNQSFYNIIGKYKISSVGAIYKELETRRPFKSNRNQIKFMFADLRRACGTFDKNQFNKKTTKSDLVENKLCPYLNLTSVCGWHWPQPQSQTATAGAGPSFSGRDGK